MDVLRSADVVVAGSATQASIKIEANCQWTLSTQSSWLSLSTNSGTGSANVQATMTANPSSLEERTADVTIRTADGIVRSITVRQERSSEQLSVAPGELTFSASDTGYQEFTVTANGRWVITGKPSWVTLTPEEGNGNANVKVTVSTNSSESSRQANLVVTADGGSQAVVKIVQNKVELPLGVSPQSLSVSALGQQNIEIVITGDADWSLSTADDWITGFSAYSGKGQQQVTFTCSKNLKTTERRGTINVVSGLQQAQVIVTQEAATLPEMGRTTLTDLTEESAWVECTVTSLFPITEYGFVYDTTPDPTTDVNTKIKTSGAPSDNTFQATIGGLTKGTTYYIRAYAVSEAGTSYGTQVMAVPMPKPSNDDNLRPNL